MDFPGLNLRLARWARRRGIRTVHLVAPQTWAWAPWRVRRVRRAVDLLLVTFPFEEAVFRAAGVPTSYVGHPLFEAPLAPPRTGADPDATAPVEIRPGSRSRDVRRQAPIALEAAALAEERVSPPPRFTVRLGSLRAEAAFRDVLARARRRPSRLEIRTDSEADAEPLRAALTTSGTSTAELAAAQVPMVVFYRASLLGRLAAAALLTTPWFAMANLLAGREVVPERLVGRGRGGASLLASDLVALLTDRARWSATRAALGAVRSRLSLPGVADRVARHVLASGVTPPATTASGGA